MARLLSVNVGLPRDIAWKGRTVHTAIWKDSVPGRCRLRLELRFLAPNRGLGQRCAAPDICPTLTRTHEGFRAHPAAPGRHNRAAVWPRWRASGDGGESPSQAAIDRPAPCSPARAEPHPERPAALRILVALPPSR